MASSRSMVVSSEEEEGPWARHRGKETGSARTRCLHPGGGRLQSPHARFPEATMRYRVLPVLLALLAATPCPAADKKVTKYARFQAGDTVAYGVVVGDTVHE